MTSNILYLHNLDETECSNRVNPQVPPPLNNSSEEAFKLREYQKQVIAELYAHFKSGIKSALIYGPTGCGKTAIAARIIADAVKKGRRVLFCCHRKKLVGQTRE